MPDVVIADLTDRDRDAYRAHFRGQDAMDSTLNSHPKLGSTLTALVEGRPGVVLPEYFRVRIIIDTQDNVDVIMRYLSDNGGQEPHAYKGGADDVIKGMVHAGITVNHILPLSNQPSVVRIDHLPGFVPLLPPANPAPPADPESSPDARAPEPPSFTDSGPYSQRYRQGKAIEPLSLPAASTGNGPLTYTLTALPEGLTFNALTLAISGTPLEAMVETTYTLTATDGNGDAVTLRFPLEIPDQMPTFGEMTIAPQSYLVNQPIVSVTLPQASGGDGSLAYILLPFLPNGLRFDPVTRTISGTPSEAIGETTYTLSALDADGDVASLSFPIAVQMPSSDIDGDGAVTFADFLIFAGPFGSRRGQARYDARCDLDGDGQIDFADFLIFAARFGATG